MTDKCLATRIELAKFLSMVMKNVDERRRLVVDGGLHISDSHHRAGATFPNGLGGENRMDIFVASERKNLGVVKDSRVV